MTTVRAEDVEDLWGYAKRLRFIQETISQSFPQQKQEEITVLDVGCGNGSQLAIPLLRNGLQLTGIDPHEDSIVRARKFASGASNAHFICGSVEDLSHGAVFDLVVLSEVLEHVEEPDKLLRASLTHLKKEGVVIITVPNGFGEFEIDWWLFRLLRLPQLRDALVKRGKEEVGSTDNLDSSHVQFFTRQRLKRMFDECNLVVTREASGSFLSGPFVAYSLARSTRFIEWNARVTDQLPFAWASSWYFALRRGANTVEYPGKRS